MQKEVSSTHVQSYIDKHEYTSPLEALPMPTKRFSRLPYRYMFGLFTTTRILLILVTYIGVVLLTAPKYSSTPTQSSRVAQRDEGKQADENHLPVEERNSGEREQIDQSGFLV